MKKTFIEMKLFQVKPDRLEQFEAKIEEMSTNQLKCEGCIRCQGCSFHRHCGRAGRRHCGCAEETKEVIVGKKPAVTTFVA